LGPDDRKTGRDQTQHLNTYTDGSKMDGGVGAGNETADVLAKEGVEMTNDRTENVPIFLRTLQSALEKQADTQAKRRWRKTMTCRISRIICKERTASTTERLQTVNGNPDRPLPGSITRNHTRSTQQPHLQKMR